MNAKRFMIWLPPVLFILLLKTTFDSSVCFQNASDMYSCCTDSTLLERAVACGGLTVLHDSLTWYSCINFPWHISPLYPLLRSKKNVYQARRKSRRSNSRIQYYPNSTASFQLLLCAGDIELNPGPDSESNTSHNKHRSKRSSSTKSNTFSLCHDMPSGLKIVHWNLQRIAPHQGNTKLDELKLLLSNPGKECHILGITETWLDANFTDSEIQIPGYNLERLDRVKVSLPFPKNGGGGIAVYIDKNIPYLRREDLESKDIESVWIKLCPPKRPAHLVCFCYRCPQYDVTSWMNKFENQITTAYL